MTFTKERSKPFFNQAGYVVYKGPNGYQNITYNGVVLHHRCQNDIIIYDNCTFCDAFCINDLIVNRVVFKKCRFYKSVSINKILAVKVEIIDCEFLDDLVINNSQSHLLFLCDNLFLNGSVLHITNSSFATYFSSIKSPQL
jgi:hypothetical protein